MPPAGRRLSRPGADESDSSAASVPSFLCERLQKSIAIEREWDGARLVTVDLLAEQDHPSALERRKFGDLVENQPTAPAFYCGI